MTSVIAAREVLGSGQLKGGVLKAHVLWVTDERTEAEVTRFCSAVPKRSHNAIGSYIFDVGWYSFADLIAHDRAIINAFRAGVPLLARELGRQIRAAPSHRGVQRPPSSRR
jgi:hypothetical protein